MLSNAYFLAKFRFATAENEPAKNLQNFAKNMLMRPALFQKMAEPFEVALLVAGSATAVPELRALEQQLGYKLQSVFAYAFSDSELERIFV